MNKRKLRKVYRKYLFSYSFEVLPLRPLPVPAVITRPVAARPMARR
jgi:hypothetical protein